MSGDGADSGSEESRAGRLLRRGLRAAGREYAAARRAYRAGRAGVPTDDEGRARIVCRRHAERRAVALDGATPHCYEAGHPACEGCVDDIREGLIETW